MQSVRTSVLIAVAALSIAGNAALVGYQWWNAEPDHVAAEPELIVVMVDGKRVSDSAVEAAAAKLLPGRYTVQAIPKPGDSGWTRQIVVSGDGPPVPTPPKPVPPTPIPPEPTPPPVVEGKRALLIVRETADTTPEFALLVNSLRNKHADYLKSKGHTLAILDDDSTDENGQPAAAVKAWEPFYKDLTLPALLIIDPATRTLVHREALGPAATADSVIATLKGHGG